MPQLEVMMLNMYAVLFEFTGVDAYGNPTIDAGVSIKCRWEGSVHDSVSSSGDPQSVPARVWTNKELRVGALLWQALPPVEKGGMTAIQQFYAQFGNPPTDVTELVQVIDSNASPDIKGGRYFPSLGARRSLYVSSCMRYSGELPTINGTGS